MKKILVVDDEKEVVEAITHFLKRRNFDVLSAFDGQEAWDKIREADFNIIILDVMMPGMGGLELCEKIKHDPELKHIPILMLSARCGDIDRNIGYVCGANFYQGKPCQPKVLLEKIEELLEVK